MYESWEFSIPLKRNALSLITVTSVYTFWEIGNFLIYTQCNWVAYLWVYNMHIFPHILKISVNPVTSCSSRQLTAFKYTSIFTWNKQEAIRGRSSPNVTFCGCLNPLAPKQWAVFFRKLLWSKMKRRDPLACSPAPSSWYPPLVWILNFPPKGKSFQPYGDWAVHRVSDCCFQKHAGRDGNNTKLSKAEFLIFMNTELGAFTKVLVQPPPPNYKTLARDAWLGMRRTAAEPPGLSELWMAIKGSFFSFFGITCDLNIRVIKLYMT